jgi:hypothetical protein
MIVRRTTQAYTLTHIVDLDRFMDFALQHRLSRIDILLTIFIYSHCWKSVHTKRQNPCKRGNRQLARMLEVSPSYVSAATKKLTNLKLIRPIFRLSRIHGPSSTVEHRTTYRRSQVDLLKKKGWRNESTFFAISKKSPFPKFLRVRYKASTRRQPKTNAD